MPIGDAFERVLGDAQAGDEAALEILYRDLAPLVLAYLRGRGARDPQDVTSETFVAVVRNLGRFRGDETNLRSWVLTIAHRRLLDERRRLGRRPEVPEDPAVLAGTADADRDDAESQTLDRLGDERVLRLLAALTDDQRSVVLLRVVADLSVKEAARVLGKRPGAVKTMHRRAMARLERVIEEENDGPGTGTIRRSGHQGGEVARPPFPDEQGERSPERP